MRVRKVGRTTGLTHGSVSAFEMDNVVIAFDIGNLRFEDSRMRAVGLLFAGTDKGGRGDLGYTYANPISAVLDALKVELITS